MHADGTLTVTGGKIDIKDSYEGLEANILNLSGGEISIVSSDDGINATNSDGSNTAFQAGDAEMNLSGAKITVTAGGDGIDSNGKITLSAGEVYINGPTSSADSAVDCDGGLTITGGTLIAVGMSGMAENAKSSTQPSVLINLSTTYQGKIEFGSLSFTPARSFNSVLISSPNLKVGSSYDLKVAGSTIQTVEISDNITTIGSNGGMMNGGGGFHGGMMNDGERPTDMPTDMTPPDGAEGGFTRPGRGF